MAQFKKRFNYRNHVQGQLVTAAELLEMQKLQYQTYCNIEADRYGLNPDGSFTPHVISGLAPRIDAAGQNIIIGRGHGWVTRTLASNDERIPIILEEDLYCAVPDGDATHPRWCHFFLQNLSGGIDLAHGDAPVATKDVNNIIRNVTTPIYRYSVQTTYDTSDGTAAASPECNVISSPAVLPIATVYIPANFTGPVDAANLYDVRWFAPGFGSFNIKGSNLTTYETGTNFKTLRFISFGEGGGSYVLAVQMPNGAVFPLLPKILVSGFGNVGAFADNKRLSILPASPTYPLSALTSPILATGLLAETYGTAGSDYDAADRFDMTIVVTNQN